MKQPMSLNAIAKIIGGFVLSSGLLFVKPAVADSVNCQGKVVINSVPTESIDLIQTVDPSSEQDNLSFSLSPNAKLSKSVAIRISVSTARDISYSIESLKNGAMASGDLSFDSKGRAAFALSTKKGKNTVSYLINCQKM